VTSLRASQPAAPALPAGRPAIPLPTGQGARPAPPIPPADQRDPGQPGPAEPRLVNPWLGRPPSGHWIALTAATAVVVIAAATATLVVEHHGSTTPPPVKAPAAARHSPAGPRTPGAAARHARPVAVAPAVASALHVHAIDAFLTRYFSAINHHDYRAYRQLFSPTTRGGLSAASFAAGYGTTRDTGALLRGIMAAPSGRVDAVVSFTSHQRSSDSPTGTACTTWSISIYLIKSGGSYVIVSPPHGYRPAFRACS
jgi:hypothetical protein